MAVEARTRSLVLPEFPPADIYIDPPLSDKTTRVLSKQKESDWERCRQHLMFEWRYMPIRRACIRLTFIAETPVIDIPGLTKSVLKLLHASGVTQFGSGQSFPVVSVAYRYGKKRRVEIRVRRV